MKNRILRVNKEDNLIVALVDLAEGESIQVDNTLVTLKEKIPSKHKFAVHSMMPGDPAYMYGTLVGKAVKQIPAGGLITTANLKHSAGSFAYEEGDVSWEQPDNTQFRGRTFMGYHRKDGKVGTMNYWLVIPLVFCENRNVKVIEAALLEELGYPSEHAYSVDTKTLVAKFQDGAGPAEIMETDIVRTATELKSRQVFKNVDGIKFLTHEGGCGGIRQDSEALVRLLAGYIHHSNVAGATVLSLGCQNAQIQLLEEAIDHINPDSGKPVYILEQQDSKSERDFISEAVKKTFVGLMEANQLKRKPAPLNKLTIGLECGGSDGFSGISANPALGYASDLLVSLGGIAILSEFPELNGVEQELLNRCTSREAARKFENLMQSYARQAVAVGSGFDMNPSPGNIRDGLVTDAMKSAGAAKKGGSSPVVDVLDYTEQATKPGLNLLCTPGNDVESTTGLAGSGANIIIFTTGLGTPTGNPVAPTIKVSSNTALAERMPDLIDINAGTIISGEDTIESKGEEILDYIIRVAGGEVIPNAVRLGQNDFIPWKRGISL